MQVLEKVNEAIRKLSHLDAHRPYLGMSSIGQCPLRLYQAYKEGRFFDDGNHRKCYQGYMYEDAVKKILTEAHLFSPGSERELVAAFDSRFRGHTDGHNWDGDSLVEIKSMKAAKWEKLRASGRLLFEHYWQVQCYLQYSSYRSATVWMINTETFELMYKTIYPDRRLWADIEAKAKGILHSIDTAVPPRCTCNNCLPY